MFRKLMLAVLVLGTLGTMDIWAVDANTATPGINRRQHRQAHRIKRGVKSGQLTKDETKGLIKDEREIQKMKRDAKSDGVVTTEERKDIHQRMNEESRKIYDEKHDAETR